MPATPLVASNRYFARGVTKVYAVTTIANIASPSRAELNAGTDLSPEVAEISGWQVSGGEIETPDLATVFTSKIPGSTAVDDSSITFYADQVGVDVRGVLPRGTATNIVIMYGGDVAGAKMDVSKTRVRSVGKPVSMGDDAGMVVVQFSITAEPAEDVTIPV